MDYDAFKRLLGDDLAKHIDDVMAEELPKVGPVKMTGQAEAIRAAISEGLVFVSLHATLVAGGMSVSAADEFVLNYHAIMLDARMGRGQ
jgi:hypothetical protein